MFLTKRFSRLLALLAVFVLIAASCGDDSDSEPSAGDNSSDGDAAAEGDAAGDDGPFDITFLQGVQGDGFYISMACGAQTVIDAGGHTLNVQGPEAFDATIQNPMIDAITADLPDALLVAPNDVEASIGPLTQAQAAGIEIVLVDTSVNDPDIGVSRIASNNAAGGGAAAEALVNLVGAEEGSVMVINITPGISTTDARQQGFEDAIADMGFNYIGAEFANNDPAVAAQIVTAALAANPDLVGIFATNLFGAQGAATGLRQAGAENDVVLVGFDAGPAQIAQLEAGDVRALIVQKPFDIGVQGVEQAIAALTGEPVTPEIGTDFVIATTDNMTDPDISQFFYKSECGS